METKKLTKEQKQKKFFIDILCCAAEYETKRFRNVRYKEITLFLPLETIEEIEGWAEDSRVE